MKLSEIKVLLESDANVFLRFYNAFERGVEPDETIVFDALSILEDYFVDYLKWYNKRPEKKQKEMRVYNDFAKRLIEVRNAMKSKNIQEMITAVDNGINQWHIDYPVVAHLSLGAEDDEQEEKWDEMFSVLRRLGRIPEQSPYKDIYE